jgi:hypothetical protein
MYIHIWKNTNTGELFTQELNVAKDMDAAIETYFLGAPSHNCSGYSYYATVNGLNGAMFDIREVVTKRDWDNMSDEDQQRDLRIEAYDFERRDASHDCK